MSKIANLLQSGVFFFQALNSQKTRFRPGFRPAPPLGELATLPRPPNPIRLEEGDTPFPYLSSRRFGVSNSAPTARRFTGPLQTKFLATPMVGLCVHCVVYGSR